MLVSMTILMGALYPLAVTGVAQVLFPEAANGSLIIESGRVTGSRLIGQPFRGERYFWPRPSATPNFAYNAAASSGSNLGPLSPDLRRRCEERVRLLRASGGDAGLPIPADLITASGSGLDPHISPEAARWQAGRVARARSLAASRVARLIEEHIEGRQFGVLGEPRVNVGALNRALDAVK